MGRKFVPEFSETVTLIINYKVYIGLQFEFIFPSQGFLVRSVLWEAERIRNSRLGKMVWIVFEKPNSILSITTAKNTNQKGAREDALVLFTFTPYIYICHNSLQIMYTCEKNYFWYICKIIFKFYNI